MAASQSESSRLCCHCSPPSLPRQKSSSSPQATTFVAEWAIPTPTIARDVSCSHTMMPPSVKRATESPVPATRWLPEGSIASDQIDLPSSCSHSSSPSPLNIRRRQSLLPTTSRLPSRETVRPWMPSPNCFCQRSAPSGPATVRFPSRSPAATSDPSAGTARQSTGPGSTSRNKG